MSRISLKDISTRAPEELSKQDVKQRTTSIVEELNELQNVLFAEGKRSLLVVLQGMDASGKDGVIRNIFGHLNPQGVTVTSFKAPSAEELDHDFLWRVHSNVPAKGMIGVFNRSHYEDILITRVHKWCDDELAKRRMHAINHFEQLLSKHNSTSILKFYLHISPVEQQERLTERMHNPTKMWKYNARDLEEAKLWDEYMKMYEDAFANCNNFPWTIVPSDQNWYKEYLIASKVLETLKSLNLQYPTLPKT
jgi:PPK2 family polyphosphate:nucleotide phosphotransferase